MAENFVQVKKIWEDGVFVGDCVANYHIINCANLGTDTPKKAWLLRQRSGGQMNYTLTFIDPTGTPDATNALVGMWITSGDRGWLVDAVDIDDILVACEECCDAEPTVIDATYTDEDGVSTFPAYSAGTLASYCITRADDGSLSAQQKFGLDYYGDVVPELTKVFSASGTSTKYTVQAYSKPVPRGADTIANGACA